MFGPERVRETGARDLNDLVQHLPAIATRPYNGGEAAAPSFSMRGLPDDGLTEYVHVLIDGVPASSLPYGWTAFSFLPITTERVHGLDFVRGGHTIRYSPNTVGGVLNFITEPIPEDPTLGFRTTLGSFDYASTMLRAGGPVGSAFTALTSVDRRGDGYRREAGFDQQDLNWKIEYDRGGGDWVAASLSSMESEHQAPGGLTLAEFSADRFANARPLNRFEGFRSVADVVFHQALDGGGWMEPYAWFSETGRHLRAQRPHFGSPTTISDWDDESFSTAVGVRASQEVEMLGSVHTFYGGVRYQREWIPSWKLRTEPFPGGPGRLDQDAEYRLETFSVHLDDTFEPLEKLTVQAGVRAEWIPTAEGDDQISGFSFDQDFATVLPGIGASYLLSEQLAVFGNIFEGFRAPQVWGFAFTSPGDELVFEEGTTMELGTRMRDTAGLSGTITAWRTEYDDFGVFFTGFYENLGRIVAHGVDLVADWELGEALPGLDGVALSASVTLQDSELRSGPNAGNETPYAWEEKAAWRVRYATHDAWHISIGGTYVGDSFSDEENTVAENPEGTLGRNPSWVLWDAQIAKSFSLGEQAELDLAVGATNLFDREWAVHSRGGFFGGGKVAGPPRQAYVSANLVVWW